MTWLTWRLHRTEAAIGILLFTGLILTMVFGMRSVDTAYDAARDGGCFGSSQSPLCGEKLDNYFNRASTWDTLTALLHGIPIAIAALVAIPTLHELERGTHRLAWTQSVSRRRWSLSRIGFALGIATLVAVIWAFWAERWREDVLRIDGTSFGLNAFPLFPAVLIGYILFAVALVLAAAVVVRRLVPALSLLAVGFAGMRIFTSLVLRERYRSPIEATSVDGFNARYDNSWFIDESWLNRAGERISWNQVDQTCFLGTSGQHSDTAYQQCLTDNGLRYFRAFHPIDRFYQFQVIETALYLGLAAGLLAFAYWWLTRRSA